MKYEVVGGVGSSYISRCHVLGRCKAEQIGRIRSSMVEVGQSCGGAAILDRRQILMQFAVWVQQATRLGWMVRLVARIVFHVKELVW